MTDFEEDMRAEGEIMQDEDTVDKLATIAKALRDDEGMGNSEIMAFLSEEYPDVRPNLITSAVEELVSE